MKNMRTVLLWIVPFLVVGIFLLYYLGLSHHFTLASVQLNAAHFKEQVAENYTYSVGMFIGVSTALIALTLPVTAPVGVVGGFLFGLLPAIVYCMIAALLGTAISYLVVRYALSHVMYYRYGKKLESFKIRMQKYGYSYLITLQLLTVVPYFIINTLAALAGVSFLTFMGTTAVGSFPIIAIYAFAGKQLYTIQSWKDILSKEMLLLLLLLAGLAMLPMCIRKLRGANEELHEDTL